MSTACAQLTLTPQQAAEAATSSWSSVFPPVLDTVQQSALFVKRLLAVGISSITYLRSLFPEDAYGDQNLDGLKLKILLKSSSCMPARKLVSWIEACSEAIDRKYLKTLTLAIYTNPDHPEVVLETYTYKFYYSKEGDTELDFVTNTSLGKHKQSIDVKNSTRMLLRTIFILTQSLQSFNKKVYLSLQLTYYEVTPFDYEPQGFRGVHEGDFLFDCDPVNLKLGEVSTRFHGVKVTAKIDRKFFDEDEEDLQERVEEDEGSTENSEIKRMYNTLHGRCGPSSSDVSNAGGQLSQGTNFEPEDKGGEMQVKGNSNMTISGSRNQQPVEEVDNAVPSVISPRTVNDVSDIILNTPKSSQVVPEILTLESSRSLDMEPSLLSTSYSNVRTPSLLRASATTPASASSVNGNLNVVSPSEPDPDFPVRCPCGVHLDDGLMIICDKCGNWQHAVCFKVLDDEEAPAHHICEMCSTPSHPCTDPTLLNESDVVIVCLYRRVLMFLQAYEGCVTPSIVCQRLGVDIKIGKKIILQLKSDKILAKKHSKWGRSVNKEELLNHAFPSYLHKTMMIQSTTAPSKTDGMTLRSKVMAAPTTEAPISSDVTPDLPIESLRASLEVWKQSGNSCEEEIDVTNVSQDVDIGTQMAPLVNANGALSTLKQFSSSQSQMGATAGDTVATCNTELQDTLVTQRVALESSCDENKVRGFVNSLAITETEGINKRKKRRLYCQSEKL